MKVFFTPSFRIGTNDSVDQIFLFLHHHFLYHVYVHDPRLDQSLYPNHHQLLKGHDKQWQQISKASVLPEKERAHHIIHLCRQHHLNLPCTQFASLFFLQILPDQLQPPWPAQYFEVNKPKPVVQPLSSITSKIRIILSSMILYLLYLTMIYIFCNCVC